jgi:hypothetical protein
LIPLGALRLSLSTDEPRLGISIAAYSFKALEPFFSLAFLVLALPRALRDVSFLALIFTLIPLQLTRPVLLRLICMPELLRMPPALIRVPEVD